MRRQLWLLLIAALAVLAGVAGAIVIAVGTGSSTNSPPVEESAVTVEPPAQVTEAVESLFSGDRDQIAEALTPSLAALLQDDQEASDVDVEIVDWVERDAFAGGTAILRGPDGESRMDVGFRLLDGAWRITYAQVTE